MRDTTQSDTIFLELRSQKLVLGVLQQIFATLHFRAIKGMKDYGLLYFDSLNKYEATHEIKKSPPSIILSNTLDYVRTIR